MLTAASVAGVDGALARATRHLLSIQSPEGYWWGEVEANVTIAAEYIMLEHFLGIADPGRWEKLAHYILAKQNADGSWPIYFGGPGELSTTAEAYFALKMAGRPADAPEMTRAREFVLAHGGVAETRVFTKLWLSLLGEFDWDAFPAMPPEAILLPAWLPLNIYEFASWARASIVPILVVWHYRPVVPVPSGHGIAELFVGPGDRHRIRFARDRMPLTWRNVFVALDAALRAAERSPWKPLRRRALDACEAWIVEHQEADGGWGGIWGPWVYSLMALRCRGYDTGHPVIAKGMDGLVNGFGLETDETFTVQPCVSLVWDTALAVTALREAGLAADHPSLLQAGRWLLAKEVRQPGDWCVKVKGVEPGGWSFEIANECYPDTDDAAEVLMALRLLRLDNDAMPARRRATDWLRAMQSHGGGWAAFDRDNTKQFVTKIPFADFGATLDPPSEDVTGHILEWLLLDGASSGDPAVKAGLRYLRRAQRQDGSWSGRWGVNHVYGVGAVLPALIAAGVDPGSGRVQRAVRWIVEHQNPDGGWGEVCESYVDPAQRGAGPSTASQTSWALIGLLAAGEHRSEAAERGIAYLVASQSPDGQWEEDQFTGTGFPIDFMLKYHLYRNNWPVWALGRYRRLLEGRPIHLPGTDPWN